MNLLFQATLGQIWLEKGKTIKIPIAAGRQRKSVYGVLNVKTGKTTVLFADKQNQETTVVFLKKIRQKYSGQEIFLIWDNAPWHKGQRIRAYLKRTSRLELWNFPPYSPQLNPQEHVWKEVRKEVSNNHLFATFEELIDNFILFFRKRKFHYKFFNDIVSF